MKIKLIVAAVILTPFLMLTSVVKSLAAEKGDAAFASRQSDLAVNLKGYGESETLARVLAESGVVIQTTSGYDDIYALYDEYRENIQPVFITTDLIFHTVHKVFDFTLRGMELEQLPMLKAFSKAMYESAVGLKKKYRKDEALKKATDRLVAYFAVPNRLLGNDIDIPSSLKQKVDKELELIQAHKGFDFSHILAQKEDFSQYAVRGHYTRNEELTRYFLASMWYGRRMFRFDETKPEGAGDPADTPDLKGWWENQKENPLPEIARTEILSACLLVYLLEKTTVDQEPAMVVFERLKAPFDFLVGRSEDITPGILSQEIKETLGKNWKPKDFLQKDQLQVFGKKMAQKSGPKIDATGLGRTGLTLFGQRFILDAFFFQKLVHDKSHPMPYAGEASKEQKPFTWVMDDAAGPVRGFPRGLDLMAILGSETAEQLLKTMGDADYKNYADAVDRLKNSMKGFEPKDNVYEGILYSFMPLFQVHEKAPSFMRSDSWEKKCLNAALGAWTQLRHDTILYSKQSYTSAPRGGMGVPIHLAYLEPSPEVYRRLTRIVDQVLQSESLVLPEYLSSSWEILRSSLSRLVTISQQELAGEYPSEAEADFLIGLNKQLKQATLFDSAIAEKLSGNADNRMPLAADVHTRMPEALTEAVGYPGKIIVCLTVDGKSEIFFGGVYTYYEFKAPYSDRLTDEAWTQRLESAEAPAPLLF